MNAGIIGAAHAAAAIPSGLLGFPAPLPVVFGSASDPHFDNVSLLLRGSGLHGSTKITDDSKYNAAITAVGDAKIGGQIRLAGDSAIAFDGSGDYLNCGSASQFAVGTGAFTVEMFVNFSALPATNQIAGFAGTATSLTAGANDAWWIGLFNQSGTRRLWLGRHGDANVNANVQWVPVLGQWYHIAATRDAVGQIRLFIDGVRQSISSTNNWGTQNFTRQLFLVGVIASPAYLNGSMARLRLTKGVARYTDTFGRPVLPYPVF